MKKLLLIILIIVLPLIISAEKLGTLSKVLKPSFLALNEKEIIVAEGSYFFVYSIKDLSFIKKFGKKGAGPGELLDAGVMPNPISTIKGGYFAEGLQKVVFYDKTGKFIRELKKPGSLTQTMPLGENFVGQMIEPPSKKNGNKMMLVLSLFDKEMKSKKVLMKTLMSQQGNNPAVLNMVPDSINFVVYKDRLYVEESHRGLIISVFDINGEKLYEINKKFKKVTLTSNDRDRYLKEFKNDDLVKRQMKQAGGWNNYKKFLVMNYPKKFTAIQELNVANDKLYITTYEKKDQMEKCVIMDLKGNVLKEVFITQTPKSSFLSRIIGRNAKLYGIINDTIYYLYSNEEEEEWEIHTFKIK